MRVLKVLCCAIALAAFVAPGARADEWNKLTYLTFSAPVQLPGVTLPAGTYAFKLADSWSNRHIVQVFDRDQSKIYGTFLTVSDQKVEPSGKSVVMFRESPAGTPTAVRAWFYPGDTIGDEFVYPKNEAVQIARNAHQPVMALEEESAPGNDVSKMKGAKVGHVDENGKMTEDKEDNRANAEASNAAPNAANANQGVTGTAGTSAAGSTASGTTGVYTAAPRETNRRTGVAENGDVMNRYHENGTSAANRTTNPSMAAGGETVSSGLPQASGTSAQNNASANAEPAASRRRHHALNNNTAVGTSGQANNNANARNGRRHLPRTASPLELMELLSGIAIAAAYGLRQLRKRYAPAR